MPAPHRDGPLEIVRVAGDRAVVFKPAGLSSERGSDGSGDSLVRRAEKALGWSRVWLPHRLDRPTRGLMVVAGSADEAARCGEEIRDRRWTKWYIARVPSRALRGAPQSDARDLIGEHRAYLKRIGRLASVVRSGGDPSRLTVLAVEPTTSTPGESHLLIRLDTGRYHQIRVMLASLGFPLVGDTDYGAPARPLTRAARAEGAFPEIDLEAIALRIEGPREADRPPTVEVHRLVRHPARRDVGASIDAALDSAIAMTGIAADIFIQRERGSMGSTDVVDGSSSTSAS